MAEYIEKQTMQAKLNRKKAGPANKRYTEGWNDAILMVKSMIHSEKAADVAPVMHGRWLCVDTDTEQFFLCNRCKKKEYWESNYCPNCGCRMDG